jgi:hypothetical protein
MASDGVKIPRRDVARIAAAVAAHEAAAAGPQTLQQHLDPVWSQWVLLTRFARALGHAPLLFQGEPLPQHELPPLSRYLTASAIPMQPTRQRVQVLRQYIDWSPQQTFRLWFRGELTWPLRLDSPAADVFAALEALTGLQGRVEVWGHLTPFTGGTVYQGRQWHIRFAPEIEEGPLVHVWEASLPLRIWQDWWWPVDAVETVWSGFPTDGRLQPGAFGLCYRVAANNLTWFHGECFSWEA